MTKVFPPDVAQEQVLYGEMCTDQVSPIRSQSKMADDYENKIYLLTMVWFPHPRQRLHIVYV